MQSVPIATKVVSSNPAHGEVYPRQHYCHDIIEILLKVALNTINQPTYKMWSLCSLTIVIILNKVFFLNQIIWASFFSIMRNGWFKSIKNNHSIHINRMYFIKTFRKYVVNLFCVHHYFNCLFIILLNNSQIKSSLCKKQLLVCIKCTGSLPHPHYVW
jgi:hypothetical protein